MSAQRSQLLAGVARVVITPPVGIRMLGYTVQDGCSAGIERDLTATALVLANDTTTVALLACDIVFIQTPHVERIRARIGDRLGIAPENVLTNCSHTHLAAMLPGWKKETGEQQKIQERYVAFLEEALAGVAGMAHAARQPARIGAGQGTVHIGMNRREKLPDGRVIIGENPTGAVDREVSVLRLDNLEGRPLATVMAAGCHTVVLGPKTLNLSPDFVGPARQIVEATTGAPCLFWQGAAGNINPLCGIGTGSADQYDDAHRLGAILAGETIKTWAALRTHNRHGPRRIVQSVATVSVWDYEPVSSACVDYLGVAAKRVTLPLAPLPSKEEAERELAQYRAALAATEERGVSQGQRNVAERLYAWAEQRAKLVSEGQKTVTRDLELWAMRLNDIGIVAVNGEPFAELSLAVKERSPLAHTIFLGYSNGCLGYLPTPEAFAEGGMEVEESVRNYLLPAQLTKEWGPAVVANALELLERLSSH